MERRTLTRADGAWFLNEEAMLRAQRRGFYGIGKVIPLGVDPVVLCDSRERTNLSPEQVKESFTVGFAGRLVPEKGVADLVHACARAGVRLLVVGDGSERKRLQRLAREYQVDTDWLGEVPSNEIWDAYRRMDLLVLPSRTTPRWKEQFGRVLVEAMACGVPVAASDSGEIPNVLGDVGRVFPEGDIEALAETIEAIRDDRDLWNRTVQRGLDRVRDLYTWPRVARMVQDLIEEAVRGKPHGDA